MSPCQQLARIMIACALTLPALQATAEQSSHEAAAERLLVQIGIDQGIVPMAATMRDATLTRIAAMDVDAGEEEIALPFLERIGTIIEDTLSWESLREDFVAAYAERFTEEELNEMNRFFSSPAGMRYLENVSELNQLAAQIVRTHAMESAPAIREITLEMQAALPPRDDEE